MTYTDKEQWNAYQRNRYTDENNRAKHLEIMRLQYQNNKEKKTQYRKERRKLLLDTAINSLLSGKIINMELWHSWVLSKNDKSKNVIYDITSEDVFDLMKLGCFYCGQLALTLDRLDSFQSHTVENCVGCCYECNSSKGALDPKTFILQSVYRQTFIYYEDEDIWHEYKTKPNYWSYKSNAERQNRSFDLSKDQFYDLIGGSCHYCKRTPVTFFGIDKLVPEDGYVIGNVVTACCSCNHAKWDQSSEQFTVRDMKITSRYLLGLFDDIVNIKKHTTRRHK